MLDMTDLSTLKWLIFKWYYDFVVEAVILFASADPVYHPIPYPAETPLSSNLGHLLLEMEIKLHYFSCTMPTCLCHTRSRTLPRAGSAQDLVLPCFFLFSWEMLQRPLSGQEMRAQPLDGPPKSQLAASPGCHPVGQTTASFRERKSSRSASKAFKIQSALSQISSLLVIPTWKPVLQNQCWVPAPTAG